MKKLLLLSLGIMYSTAVCAWGIFNQNKLKKEPEASVEKDYFSIIDVKMLHDRKIVQEVMWTLYDQSRSTEKRDRITSSVFNEKDSNTLETTMDNKGISYKITPELMEKANKHPFEAYKDLIKSVTIPKINRDEVKTLNQVDKKAISQNFQMITESGPDVGAKQVSVIYNETKE